MVEGGNNLDKWLTFENIKRYQKKLEEARDEEQRRMLHALISAELKNLAKTDINSN